MFRFNVITLPLPLHLLPQPLPSGLSLHLLNLDAVGLAAPHVQLVVAQAQLHDELADSLSWGVEYEILGKKRRKLYFKCAGLSQIQISLNCCLHI